MNNRRELLVALGASALAAPFSAFAQPQGKVWRIGLLRPSVRPASPDSATFFGAFVQGLRELGYVEGKNLVIERRYADTTFERLPGLAAELVQLKMDVILAVGTPATGAAHKATTTIPIVFVNAGDPIGSGFIKSLARPGGNITGLTPMLADISSKYLEMLLDMAPKLSRVAVLINPGNPAQFNGLKNIQAAGQKTQVKILPVEARNPQEIEAAFIVMAREKAGAVIVLADGLFNQQRHQVAELAAKYRLPSVGSRRAQVEAGFLMSYGPNDRDMFRRAATYVDKIFKGTKPADLPVEQPTRFEMYVNRKTAKALGLTIPPALLISAEVIE
jgi:putative ABC transport system substrate-binding protein